MTNIKCCVCGKKMNERSLFEGFSGDLNGQYYHLIDTICMGCACKIKCNFANFKKKVINIIKKYKCK